ncbi:MAG: hypothetical protein AAFY25_06430 [Pseudomonadota bacterium]
MIDLRPVPPRSPNEVMKLSRMGSFHQSRLSFMRQLLRRMADETWTFETQAFDFDARGVGHAIYTVHGPERSYSLVAFAHDLPPEARSDRVIATAWDATFALFDGIPNADDIDRLKANVPYQEEGRVSGKELTLSRANRSVRLWDHVVERLSQGLQPDPDLVDKVGYLMRTTAVYGSGKFGAADREAIADRPECQAPFQVEMLTVYLIRTFVMDLVEHLARARAPDHAVPLTPQMRRRFGIGNSTGLGMAPFLVTHPALLNAWIAAREEALSRVRSLSAATTQEIEAFRQALERARLHAYGWHSDHTVQRRKLSELRVDMDRLADHTLRADLIGKQPWNRLFNWAEAHLSEEGQEMLVSLLLEPYGPLVDGLASCMATDEALTWRIDGAMTTDTLRIILEDVYDWALALNWDEDTQQARIWYVSANKLEPRLGQRFEEPLEPYEQPLCPGRDAARLYRDLSVSDRKRDEPLAAFLLRHPEHRHMTRRAQIAARLPYAEIRDNTIDGNMMPIDMLRMKLSFFGASEFDPRSDRWVRITMFQHAPFPHELSSGPADDWALPPLYEAAE